MNDGLKIPRATYRLQFHRDFTLRDALPLAPYLHELGVSHVYASPLLTARKGSMHGYDVCDPTKLNPELGTEADLEALVHALHERGMGLVLDIVPNHMAASPENPWWWDVLQFGPASVYATYFDIEWHSPDPQLAGKVLLPVLGDELERVLERGELKVACEGNEVVVRYYDHRFPTSPGSLVVPEKTLAEAVSEFNASRTAMAKFLEQQPYRLAFWRHGDTRINYRRFFNIVELAGLRVELPQVFTDSHNRILEWHQRGWVDGLRIDHPDGLHDPEQYLQRLRQAAPGAWITVEKILEPGEALPADWPVAGTTGYDFLNRVTGLFVDSAGEKPVTDFYAEFTGEPTDYHAIVREKKRLALQKSLPAEISRLVRLLQPLTANEPPLAKFTEAQMREALIELVADFPVYRTYVQADARCVGEEDVHQVEFAVKEAQKHQPDLGELLNFSGDLLLLKIKAEVSAEFVMRFQQLTGPAMAKGVEDTTYYCFNRLVALNVVGGNPGQFGWSADEFHKASAYAQSHWPHAMLATSTHDTKRSEDVRARLSLLSEIPAEWAATVRRWSVMNEKHRSKGRAVNVASAILADVEQGFQPGGKGVGLVETTDLSGRSRHAGADSGRLEAALYGRQGCLPPPLQSRPDDFPDRNAEYLFYQAVLGAWPLSVERAVAYLEKSVREAKQHTTWTETNQPYEAALKTFVTATLGDKEFIAEVEQFLAKLIEAGRINSLAQTLLKLTTPGVPDIYQGTELWDLSLVDPDNRRPVDYAVRKRLLAELPGLTPEQILARSDEGLPKLWLIQETLAFRREHPELFGAQARYVPLTPQGSRAEQVVAFARIHGADAFITVVPRLPLKAKLNGQSFPVAKEWWQDTYLPLPNELRDAAWHNVLTGQKAKADFRDGSPAFGLANGLLAFPVALLAKVSS